MEERTAHISADPGLPPEEGSALPPHIRLRQHRTGSISMTFSAVRPIAGSVAIKSDDEDSGAAQMVRKATRWHEQRLRHRRSVRCWLLRSAP